MLSPRHRLVGLLAISVGGLWNPGTARAQNDCPIFDPDQPRQELPREPDRGTRNLENFGFSLALEGKTLAVGAPGHGAMGSPGNQTNNAGKVYLFTREGTDWRRQDSLDLSDGSEDSEIQFGRAVALSGDVLAVGAPEENVDGEEAAGRVHLFERTNGAWTRLGAPLTAGDANLRAGAKLGFSLGLDGDLLVVGAPFDPSRGRFAGAVYVFRRTGDDWTPEAGPLTAEDTGPFDAFGTSVAVSDERFVVGAPLHDEEGERGNSGAAYLFQRDGQGEWTERKILPGEGPAEDDLYGFAVAMDGDTVVVGARAGDTDRGADTGAAFVFTCGATGCVEQAQLAACDGQPRDEFGAAVAVQEDRRIDDGDLVVVGARRNDDGNEDSDRDSGAAYIYRLIDGVWIPQARVAAGFPGPSDQAFGRAVAVAGPHVVSGESLSEGPSAEKNAGSAHVFTAQADLGVTDLRRDVDPVPGTEVTHHVTFRNDGSSPAIGAELEVVFARGDPASATGPLLSALTGECQCHNEQCTEVKGLPPDARSRRFAALVDLFPGGEVRCEVRPLVAPDARGVLVATAEIKPPPTVEEPQSEELPNSQELTSTLQPRADLVLQPTATSGFGVPGGNPNIYRFTVTNKGPSDVLLGEAVVSVDFKIPGSPPPVVSIECTADRGSCGRDEGDHRKGQGVFNQISLQRNGTLTYVVRVQARPDDRGRIEGELKVEAMQGLVDKYPNNNETTVETRLEPQADLVLTPTEPLPKVGVPGGNPSHYEFTVTNKGPSDVLSGEALVTTTHVVNGLPKDAPCTSDGTPREPIEGEVSDLITLQRDGKLSYDVTVQIDPRDRGRLEGALAVVATGGLFDMTPSSNESCVPILLEPRADLAVAFFDGPKTAVPGARDPITYRFQVTNDEGPSTVLAGEAVVAATFGEELSFDCTIRTDDGNCVLDGNLLDCLINEDDGRAHGCTLRDSGFQLSPGGVLTYTVEARARPVLSPRVENVAAVMSPLDEDENEDEAFTTLTPVDLELTKVLATGGMEDDQVYCLQVANPESSEGTAEGIRLFDPTPPGLTLLEVEGACPSCTVPADLSCSACTDVDVMVLDRETGCFPCHLDTLAPEEQACLQVRFLLGADDSKDDQAGSVDPVNLASLTTTTADPNAENNFAQTSTDAEPEEDEATVTLKLVDAPIRIDNGEDLRYELEIDPVSTDTSLLLKVTTGHGVEFTAPDPPPCETQQCPPSADPEAQCLACSLGELAGNGPATIQVTLEDVRVQTDENTEIGIVERFLQSQFEVVTAETPMSNTVEVLTGIGKQEPANLTLAVLPKEPMLAKETATPVTLRITNAGPGPAREIRVIEGCDSSPSGGRVTLRDDAIGLCEALVRALDSEDTLVCRLVDPDPLTPGSIVLLPVLINGEEPVGIRVTTDAPDPQGDNCVEVGKTTNGSLASPRPTSLVPRRLGASGPP